MAIVFHELVPVRLKDKKRLKAFLFLLFKREGKLLDGMNIVFCSDEYLLDINKQHLQHDFYTDIITFDLSERKNSPVVAELYISIDRVMDNASLLKTKFSNELHRVIFHGALHLCGFGDKSKKDIALMRLKEEEYLNLYFLGT
jgi:probable rRNA maturation factor